VAIALSLLAALAEPVDIEFLPLALEAAPIAVAPALPAVAVLPIATVFAALVDSQQQINR
jgi:hypothetical protein